MYLSDEQLKELCNIAKKAASLAGDYISQNKGTQIEVQSKVGGENIASCVVTEIDLKAQEIIIKTLEPTLKKYDLGLLAEESLDNNSRFEKDYFWCIDPLDGTLCFSKGEDGYSTSIALIKKDGTPMIGVVYNPRADSLYHAVLGLGAFKDESPLKVNTKNENLTLLFDQSYLKYPEYAKQVKELKIKLKEIGLKELNIHPLGGAVMNGISTIEMAPAFYYKFPKKTDGGGSLWDFAASSIIQSEAGGFNSDYYLNPLDLNRKETTFMNHKGVIYCSSKDLLGLIPKVD